MVNRIRLSTLLVSHNALGPPSVALLFLLVAAAASGREPSTGSPCSIEGAPNCQLPASAVEFDVASGYLSDLTVPPNGVVAADDFVPQATTLTDVCVWGFYHDATLTGDDAFDCMDAVDDEFRIRVYADDNGLPGALVGESLSTGLNILRGPATGTAFEKGYGGDTNAIPQGYTLTLETPIFGLVLGERHWLEVVNNTTGPTAADRTCWWNWLQHFPAVGDGYSASGANSGGTDDPAAYLFAPSRYMRGSGRPSDLAFCLGTTDGPLDFDSGTPVTAACWTCADPDPPVCTVETALQCASSLGIRGRWNLLDSDCSGSIDDLAGLIDGDTCVDPDDGARVITDGLHAMNTNCADTDGADTLPPNANEGPPTFVGHDVWFHYIATCTGEMTVNACPTQLGITQDGLVTSDGVIGIYHDPENPSECLCPGASNEFLIQYGSDEGCNGLGDAGSGILSRLALTGECYTIRVTNFGGTSATAASGPAMIDVDCPVHEPLRPPPAAPEQIPDELGVLANSTKNRFLSFESTDQNSIPLAFRVTFVNLPPPYHLWNGESLWVGEPADVQSCPGLCGPLPVTFLKMATLTCDAPVYVDWSDLGIVHVYYEGIVPGGTYSVDAIYEGSSVLVPSSFSDPIELSTAVWGDTIGTCEVFPCTPPDGSVQIADILAIVTRFQGVLTAINIARAAIEPACVDFQINITDVLHGINAFMGLPYPFEPTAPDPCDSTCPNILP